MKQNAIWEQTDKMEIMYIVARFVLFGILIFIGSLLFTKAIGKFIGDKKDEK